MNLRGWLHGRLGRAGGLADDAELVPPSEGCFSLPSHLPRHPPPDLLTVGKGTYGQPEVVWFWGDSHRCRVGSYCSLNATAKIYVGGEHRTDWVSTFAFREAFGLPGRYEGGDNGLPASRGDVVIGSDVWVGAAAAILSGVHIGDGAVIGGHAVVAKDVPPYAIVAGNPARVLRYRFGPNERAALLRICWWNWPEDKIVANLALLQSPDVEAFLVAHDETYRNTPVHERYTDEPEGTGT